MSDPADKLPVVVLISGGGTNLQALIDAQGESCPFAITCVISNRPEARGLARARASGIDTQVIDHTDYPDRESFDRALGFFQAGNLALIPWATGLVPLFEVAPAHGRLAPVFVICVIGMVTERPQIHGALGVLVLATLVVNLLSFGG